MRATAVLARGAAWPALLGLTICAAVVGVCTVFAHPPSALLVTALALLGAAGGFALDEHAAAITDVAPLHPARVLAARAISLTPPWLVGAGIAALAARAGGPSAFEYGLPLIGGPIFGFAVAHLIRRRVDEPGAFVAILFALLVMATTMTAVVRQHVQLVPSTLPSTGLNSDETWTIILATCLGTLAIQPFGSWHRAAPRSQRAPSSRLQAAASPYRKEARPCEPRTGSSLICWRCPSPHKRR